MYLIYPDWRANSFPYLLFPAIIYISPQPAYRIRTYLPISLPQMMTANSLAICLVKLGRNEAALASLTSYLANHTFGESRQIFVCALEFRMPLLVV